MQKKTMPAPSRAGTSSNVHARALGVLAAIGDDPCRLIAAIELMDRMLAKRRPRRRSKKY